MSSIPELDRLIEETDLRRVNREWNQRDMLFTFGMRFMVAATLTTVAACLLGIVAVGLAPVAMDFAGWLVPHQKPRDLDKRYKVM
jgi:hypothetical protein